MPSGNPRTLRTRANFASTPLAGGSQPATESAAGQRGGDHALFGVHSRRGSTVRRRDNECVARAVCDLPVSSTFVTAPGRVVSTARTRHERALRIERKHARWRGGVAGCFLSFSLKKRGGFPLRASGLPAPRAAARPPWRGDRPNARFGIDVSGSSVDATRFGSPVFFSLLRRIGVAFRHVFGRGVSRARRVGEFQPPPVQVVHGGNRAEEPPREHATRA